MAELQGVDSSEERKSQRRSRVRAKLEEARRQELGIRNKSPPPSESDPEKDRFSSQQIAKSKERLKKLVSDGDQLVSGVMVAGYSREVNRRLDEDESKKARYEKIEAEANASSERFEEIMKKWSDMNNKKIPKAVQDLLQQQKQSCQEMMDEKNKLIAEFEEELKMKDDRYVKNLRQQAEDVDLLVERMEEQAHSLVCAFREELDEIEKSFVLERQQLLELHQKALSDAKQERRDKEADYLETREKRLEANEAKIQHLRVQNAEEFNQVKIKLETDVQHLQQQIQQMKATFQLNAEKLEYNFQVLKKRDEENSVTISQQKRKLTRLQDNLNNLRSKLAKQEKTNREDVEYLMNEYRKNVDQYKELQKKVRHFQLIDVKRFYDIWRMNEDKVRALAEDVANVDQVIHHQQLGLGWNPPPMISSDLQPLMNQMSRDVNEATVYASQVLSDADNEDHAPNSVEITHSFPHPVIRSVLELIATEGSFLLESKLSHLLAPLDKDEQMLMKLDSIFKALGIKMESEVDELVTYFIEDKHQTISQDEESNLDATETPISTCSSSVTTPGVTIIHPNDVPHALKRYTENHQTKGSTSSSKQHIFGLQTSRATDELLDGSFWTGMANSLPKIHEQMWTALQDGLERYHTTLSARSKLIDETESLGQQNAELRLLLQQYMHSRINQDLEIPPTLVMPTSIDTTIIY